MFRRRWLSKNDRAVVFDARQKLDHCGVIYADKKSMVPGFYDVFVRERLDAAEVSDHALFGIAGGGNNGATDSYFNGIAMPVQMAAETRMIGNAMAGVELKSAGNAHKKQLGGKRGADYSIAPCAGRLPNGLA